MGITGFLLWGGLAALLAYGVLIYNGLIRLRNNVDNAFANIEVLLKQRHTELPRLVEICSGYMKHERQLLQDLVAARNRVHEAQVHRDIEQLGRAETQVRSALASVFGVVEAYPELKASENMLALQQRLSQLEDTIADRREIFNESVRLNNTRIQEIPDVLLARLFDFTEQQYLQFDAEILQVPSVAAGRETQQ